MNTTEQMAQLVTHPTYGFKRLDPIPSDATVEEFYRTDYYRLIRQGGRAPILRRLTSGTAEGEQEREWLQQTVYADLLEALRRHAPDGPVLDMGCGPGELVAFLANQGVPISGFEPSQQAAAAAASRGLNVTCNTIESYLDAHRNQHENAFAAVLAISVLEHLPDPVMAMQACRELLQPGGILITCVPNDFSELQAAAHAQIAGRPWWVAYPDHINYFSADSLRRLYEGSGFEVADLWSDFPIEMFLLFGEDYTKDPELGTLCHRKRMNFERGISPELRRRIYRSLATVGVGRTVSMVGRRKDP